MAVLIVQMLASIFQQLGGHGHVPGFMAGDGGNASGLLKIVVLTSPSVSASLLLTIGLQLCRREPTAATGTGSQLYCAAGGNHLVVKQYLWLALR